MLKIGDKVRIIIGDNFGKECFISGFDPKSRLYSLSEVIFQPTGESVVEEYLELIK